MPINECSPQNVFGDYSHHLFLGCSVIDFSASLGFNEQATQVTIRLAKDDCAALAGSPKIYFDPSSSISIRQEWANADPGLYSFGPNNNEAPEIGSPVYFRVEDFEFAGILQSYRELDSQQGKDIFEIVLVSPQVILEGCQVIINDYAGNVGNTYNLFNVFGFHESFGAYCPPYILEEDGILFGSEAYGFGGAQTNEKGMQWIKIKSGLSFLTSAIIPAQNIGYGKFSPYGRIVHKGSNNSHHKFGLMPYNEIDVRILSVFGPGTSHYISHYLLDLSDMPIMPFDYRIDGTVISVLDLISTVCNDAASDYYIELVPVRVANLVYKIIKVRSVLRTSQPSTNFISQYINSIDNYVGRYSGAELRNDFNNKVVLGGNKQIIWQCEYNSNPPQDLHESCLHQAQLNHIESADDTITPFWGTKSNGDVILTKLDLKGSWEFDLETATINLSLKTLSLRVGTVA
ncbi:MAG: hypothetical protein ACW99Q_17365, partial [Candidatus Kariarchaeaceae archaeon]